MKEVYFSLFIQFAMCLLKMACSVVSSTSPAFLPVTPGREWIKVGNLNMTDPKQKCPDSWQTFTSPRTSCGKKSSAPCDSLNIPTSGARYQTVCGRFRGYQVGSPDAFSGYAGLGFNIETYYVDGVSVTYGSPGNRRHVFTYVAGFREAYDWYTCPCAGGRAPPSFVDSDYYCESGNPGPGWILGQMYSSDVLWDRQQCGGNESTCCNPPDLPWFCKTFSSPISEDLEVRICMDENVYTENVAIESFELYVQDINECNSNGGLGPCQQICTNTLGSFNCSCQSGYTLSGFNCTDINECNSNGGRGPCQQICINTNGSFMCSCHSGYTLSGLNCTDINECEMNDGIGPCAQVCINTVGSYNCSCHSCMNGLCINGSCLCVSTYSGGNCSQPSMKVFSGCELNPCLNGGVCIQSGELRTCVCPSNTTGVYCENSINSCLLNEATASLLSNLITRRRHLGTSQSLPAKNCAEIKYIRSEVTTGVYWILSTNETSVLAFCQYL